MDGDGWNGKVECRARMRNKLSFERDVYVAYCNALYIMITPPPPHSRREGRDSHPLGVIAQHTSSRPVVDKAPRDPEA